MCATRPPTSACWNSASAPRPTSSCKAAGPAPSPAAIGRWEACPPAARLLDLARRRRLADDWPQGGWERQSVRENYRLALLRGVSAGHFLRRVAGTNV